MGIQDLTKTIKKHAAAAIQVLEPRCLPGTIYGVDVFSYLYPAKYNPGAKGKGQHVRYFLDMITGWHAAGKRLVFVFDGNTSEVAEKAETIKKRTEIRQKNQDIIEEIKASISTGTATVEDLKKAELRDIKISTDDITDIKCLCRSMEVPFYQAEGEADSVLARLFETGVIHGVISEDSDILTHGINLVVRGLIDGANRNSGVVNLYRLDTILSSMELSMERFISLCILLGCDYCPRISGIGPVTALKHIKSGMDPLELAPNPEYKSRFLMARNMFTDHNVPLNMGASEGEGTEALEARGQLTGASFKAWVLSITNYTEKTLTERLNSYFSHPVPEPKKPLKIIIKPKLVQAPKI